jgi:extracellular factor (EF) 3-hydroxypalmitic acid methyl ester biosynthesis protein
MSYQTLGGGGNLDQPALTAFLDQIRERLLGDNLAKAMEDLCLGLNSIREQVDPVIWDTDVKSICLNHEIRRLLHQDPYTFRAFEKPRGYAGDAVMLDFIYNGFVPPETTPLGRAIFKGVVGLPNSLSVLARRRLLAEMIDDVADSVDRPNVLSIACGHLREAQCSRAVRDRRIGLFVALDQDLESLRTVDREQCGTGVATVCGSVRSILAGNPSFADLDLIYAAGLFDYLADPVAARLTGVLIEMLAPGGKLLIGNFTPCNQGRGYMETFMDWKLVYRDPEDLRMLKKATPGNRVASERIFLDQNGNVAYLVITAAGKEVSEIPDVVHSLARAH